MAVQKFLVFALCLWHVAESSPESSFLSPFLQYSLVQGVVNLMKHTVSTNDNKYVPEDFLLTGDLINQLGYKYEKHSVETKDGYILTLHQIFPKKRGIDKPPVLIQHGLVAASDTWLLRQNSTIASTFLNNGYEVWLSDQRGNAYSKKHKYYSVKEPNYWNFTFHQSGIYDMPAFIDHILYVTKKPQIYYIGHSMGTTVFLTMASERPEYNTKVKAAALLAPIATLPTLSELTQPLLRLALIYADSLKDVILGSKIYELLPRTGEVIKAVRRLCKKNSNTIDYCLDIAGMVCGENRKNLDMDTFTPLISRIPAGTSSLTVHHLSQIYKYGFRQYDYGQYNNFKVYGTPEPPEYKLDKITAPVALFFGDNDNLMNERSANELASRIPNAILNRKILDPKFSHADFLAGTNAQELLYDEIFALFENLLSRK